MSSDKSAISSTNIKPYRPITKPAYVNMLLLLKDQTFNFSIGLLKTIFGICYIIIIDSLEYTNRIRLQRDVRLNMKTMLFQKRHGKINMTNCNYHKTKILLFLSLILPS